jgi:hypothetical protein
MTTFPEMFRRVHRRMTRHINTPYTTLTYFSGKVPPSQDSVKERKSKMTIEDRLTQLELFNARRATCSASAGARDPPHSA